MTKSVVNSDRLLPARFQRLFNSEHYRRNLKMARTALDVSPRSSFGRGGARSVADSRYVILLTLLQH